MTKQCPQGCREEVEDHQVQARELQRRFQRLQQEQEELVERNEELEALLGEIQNNSKAERQRQEGELEGQLRKIKSLEAELKLHVRDQTLRDGDISRETDTNFQQLRGRSHERMALLEARLTEEKDWRKQLELDLSAAQAALKKDKEALQIGERELQRFKIELASLQTECQQGKTLIKSLTQVKGEKGILQEKVAQLERSQSRLQSELERQRENNWAQEDLRESRRQVDQLQDQLNRFTSELDSLQKEHSILRDDLSSERRQTIDLQAQLSVRMQEKLAAEGEKEMLGLELQRLRQQLQLFSRQVPHPQTGPKDHSPTVAEQTKDDAINQLSSVKWELSCLQNTLEEERQLASQHQLALQAQLHEAHSRTKSQDSLLGQKTEEGKQLKQDLHRTQSLFTSAEKELRYEREKNLDLKRHNTLLEQEKLKLNAELKQVQSKLLQAEQSAQGQAAECERQRHNLRELELELARSTTSNTTNTALQEELIAERACLFAANKKVLDLQQQLKTVQHQLRLEEARAGESSRLERESRDVSDALAALRSQQQEEHITRKLLEQREEELQQQVRSLRLKEATLARTNSELSHHAQQVETRRAILEAESIKTQEEKRETQRLCHRLEEELVSSQQDSGRLQEELQKVITQLDANIRKYNEKQSQHKIKLGQAKQIFLKTMSQRDHTIQKLENDLALASSLSHKEKDWIRTVTEENEKLLVEKTELLRRMSEEEEKSRNSMSTASTLQHKVKVLELENQQLQERTLKLSNQVGSLERALRDVKSVCSLEQDVRKMFSTDMLSNNCFLQSPTMSLRSDLRGPLGILDTICRVKVSEERIADNNRASLSTSHTQPSELGYLNLTSPLVPPDTKDPKENKNGGSDQV
ncbi:coiled-coil domain-containing protein 30 [Aplochiton taeniatus]